MSLFGEPLPFEDDTATSLIRRAGFPPDKTYDQMPEVYLCPCCSEFSKQQERERLLREARDAKEAERRKLMQLDVFEERARPLPSGDSRRKTYRRIAEDDEPVETAPSVPPPPPTIDDLRRAKKDQNVPKLVVTVHHGRNISAEAPDPISVIVRCGAFEGQTAKVQRGKEVATPWEELFEFPYMNSNEPLEVLVVNDALPETNDQLVGGVVVPSDALHDRTRGDQEPLPVMPEESMQTGYGTCQEGPLGAIVASWYVRDGDEKIDEEAMEQQTLSVPLGCMFVAHRVFQYTDHGAEPYPGGVLCVLRDTDDNCSESVLYTPGPNPEPSLSPYYTKEGYHYLPENPSQIMQLNTEKKLGHILICVPKQEESAAEEEEELLVIGAVPLDFERLYHKGSAVLLIESKSKEDALWGEIAIEWANKPLDEEEPHPASLEVQKESLFVTVVRGLNLVRRDGEPVETGYVSVATGDLEGATVEAPRVEDEEDNHVINWNQEVRFIEVDPNQRDIEVQVYEDGRLVCIGECELDEQDEGVVIVSMHQAANASEDAGEIVVSYKRLHAPPTEEEAAQQRAAAAAAAADHGADEEDEEREEQNAAAAGEEDEEDEEPLPAKRAPSAQRAASSHKEETSNAAHSRSQSAQSKSSKASQHDAEEADEEAEEEAYAGEGADAADCEEGAEEAQEDEAAEQEQEQEQEELYPEEDEDAQREEQAQEDEAEQEQAEEAREAAQEEDDEAQHEEDDEAQEKEEAYPTEDQAEENEDNANAAEDADQAEHEGADEDEAAEAAEGADQAEAEQEEDGAEGAEGADDAEGAEGAQGEEDDEPQPEESEPQPYEGEGEDEADEAAEAEPGEYQAEEQPEEEQEPPAMRYGDEQEPATAGEQDQAAYSVPAGKPQRRRLSWAAASPKKSGYQQPWYPSGAPETDQHIPFSKTKLSKKNRENIRELETRKMRIEEESVRRASTPRRSSTRGGSPNSQ